MTTALHEQRNPTYTLLALPDETIVNIITFLGPHKRSFSASCRHALQMTFLAAKARLRITQACRFPGIRKVIEAAPTEMTLEITCPVDTVENYRPLYDRPFSALHMFMGLLPNQYLNQVAAKCCWERITKVEIQGVLMRCLIPHFIAATCPQLLELKVMQLGTSEARHKDMFSTFTDEAMPLGLCSNLTRLELGHSWAGANIQLPPVHHSANELYQNLPNITCLVIKGSNAVLIDSFAAQLTALEASGDSTTLKEPIRKCTRLELLRTSELMLPGNAGALKVLDLSDHMVDLSDDAIGKLVDLPSLTSLKVYSVGSVEQDWSGHVCNWHELHVRKILEFTALANLPLGSLKELCLGPFAAIRLPRPSMAGSASIQRAASNLLHAIIVPHAGDSIATLKFDLQGAHVDTHVQQAISAMVNTAAQRIGLFKACDLAALIDVPLVLETVLTWGHAFLDTICFSSNYILQPRTWHALHQLRNLENVVFPYVYSSNDRERTLMLFNISSVVCSAVEHYVLPAKRSLRLMFHTSFQGANHEETVACARRGEQFLFAAIQEALPAGGSLRSVKYCFPHESKFCDEYGLTRPFWSIVVAASR